MHQASSREAGEALSSGVRTTALVRVYSWNTRQQEAVSQETSQQLRIKPGFLQIDDQHFNTTYLEYLHVII